MKTGCRAGEAECLTHGQWLTHCDDGVRALVRIADAARETERLAKAHHKWSLRAKAHSDLVQALADYDALPATQDGA